MATGKAKLSREAKFFVIIFNYTVADYRWFTVQLQLKTLLLCILLLTPAIEVIYY
jgi:hypothetical protein